MAIAHREPSFGGPPLSAFVEPQFSQVMDIGVQHIAFTRLQSVVVEDILYVADGIAEGALAELVFGELPIQVRKML